MSNSVPSRSLDHEQSLDLQRIADLSPNLLFVTDLSQEKVIYINHKVEQLLGWKKDDVKGSRPAILKSLLHPEDLQPRLKSLEKCKQLEDHEESRVEIRFRKGNGEWNWFRITDKVFKRSAEGTVLQVISSAEDIHEEKRSKDALKKVEKEVRKKQELLETTMCSSSAMIQVFRAVRDAEGTIIDFKWVLNNDTSEGFYGDVIGKSLLESNPGVVKEGIFDTFKKVVETGVPDTSERHYVHEQFNGWFSQSAVKLGDGLVTTTTDITDLKKIQQELLESKRLLQNVIDAPDIGMAVYKAVRNENGEIINFVHEYINRASLEILGGEDFTGELFTAHGENAVVQLPQFIEVLETNKSNSYLRETDFRGRKLWFAVTNSPLDRERLVHTFEDITDRKNTEREIIQLKEQIAQRATDKYETLFNSIEDGFCVLELVYDDEGVLQDLIFREHNPVFFKHTGLKDVIGKSLKEVFPHYEQYWMDVYRGVAETGEPVTAENFAKDLGRWYKMQFLKVGDTSSKLVATVFEDITDRKKAEKTLRESEERLQKAISIDTVGVLFFDLESNFHDANDTFLHMIGHTREELANGKMKSENVTLPEWMPRTREALRELALNGRFSPYEKELIRPDGTRWWGLFAGMRLDEKECVEFVVDITATKKAEEALIGAKEKAEAAARAKEDFLSTMSHEIRTPLNAVIGLTNLLLSGNPREDQLENLNSLSFSARNLLALINDILDFSKMEAGKVELKEIDFNLNDLLQNLKKSYDPQAQAKRTSINIIVDEHIPERIAADQVKLSQILNNLVSNAIKFTPEGEITVSVAFNRKEEEVIWLDFSVKDTGIGIEADKAEFIFEKFMQADPSTVQKYGGTGLGLSITKLLLDLMNSEIKLESTPGKGSNFYFSLPVLPVEHQEHLEELTLVQEDVRQLENLNVLLVEDVEINRNIVSQFLENWWQLKPDEAVNGEEAVEKAKEKNMTSS